jgi:hypothetical protein
VKLPINNLFQTNKYGFNPTAQLSDDKSGLEAIRALHRQLDDDANGNVDLSESDEVNVEFLITNMI